MFIRKSLLSAGLTLTMVSAQAADPWSLSHVTLNELKQTIHVDASPTVRHIRPSTQSALSWLAQHTDERGVEHVRLQQYYLGFPVWGGYAILHRQSEIQTINSETFRTRLNGVIFRDLDADLGQPPHDFTFRGNMALEHLKARYATKTVHEAEIKPLIYVDEQQKPHWAYQVSFFIHRSDHIPMRPTAIVDAVTFEPFIEWNEVKTLKTPVKGLGFGGNAGGKQVQYGQDKPFLLLTRDSVKQLCSLENQHVSVRDMASDIHGPGEMFTFDCKTPADAYWTGSDKDGYDRVNEAYSPSNDALYIGTLVHDMYKQQYGVNALGTATKSQKLLMRVHYGKGFENAFWDGKQMTFGDGGDEMYPLVSLSVGAHEISHGFTEQYSDLAYMGQSGGMNEAFSDMAAQAAEYYAEAKNSWMIGAEILKAQFGQHALRFMDNPTQDGQSIDKATAYRKGMNVHYSSGVYNRFFYLLATQPGWNTQLAFRVMLKANMDYWTPYSTFQEGACGVLWAADDLNLSLEAIEQAFAEVEINTARC